MSSRRGEPNVVLTHYQELSADLAGEMRRVAARLGITVPADRWPALIEAATFRWHGHYEGDPQVYKTDDEKKNGERFDPIARMKERASSLPGVTAAGPAVNQPPPVIVEAATE